MKLRANLPPFFFLNSNVISKLRWGIFDLGIREEIDPLVYLNLRKIRVINRKNHVTCHANTALTSVESKLVMSVSTLWGINIIVPNISRPKNKTTLGARMDIPPMLGTHIHLISNVNRNVKLNIYIT